MPTKKKAKPKALPRRGREKGITFRSNKTLFDWMQDEYLSEITLDDVKPAPKKTGGPRTRVVDFTWSLHGTGNGDIVPFHVRAAGVRTWTIDGTLGKQAIGMTAGKERGIHFFMDTPARIELACDIVEVRRGEVKKGKRKAEPFTKYDHFHAEANRRITIAQLLDAFGAPADVELSATPTLPSRDAPITSPAMLTELIISARGAPWIKVYNFNHNNPNGFNVRVSRLGGTDDEWHRAQEMPHRLGPCRVSGAWDFFGDDVAWMALIGKAVKARAPEQVKVNALERFNSFSIEGTHTLTLKGLIDAVAPPAGAKVKAPYFDDAGRVKATAPGGFGGPIDIKKGEWSWAKLWWSAPQRPGNAWRVSFTRNVTTDDEWRRVMQAPRVLNATWVHSGSKLMGKLEKWLKAIDGV